jgi:hypothetical protein
MAVYKLYINKDTTLYSEAPSANTGKDEIIELSGYLDSTGDIQTSRILLQYDTEEFNNIIQNKVKEAPYIAHLTLKLAEASEIPVNFTVQAYPIAKEWDEGRGKFGDIPEDNTGASWAYSKRGNDVYWIDSSYEIGTTGSFPIGKTGGGLWTTSNESPVVQTFTGNYNLDLNLDITDILAELQRGILLKLEDAYEFNSNSNIRLKYFSSDTNTVYNPHIIIGWDDSLFTTGSLSQIPRTSQSSVSISNLREVYYKEEEVTLYLKVGPRYPIRTFTTSSIYLENYYFPESTYWGIKDTFTQEVIVPFSEFSTKVSCDETGPFFRLFCNTLPPERYYNIVLKVVEGDNVTFHEIKPSFKVMNYAR